MSGDPDEATGGGGTDRSDGGVGRRDLLKYGAGAGALAVTGGVLGWRLFGPDPTPGVWEAGGVDRAVIDRYAPRLSFGARERWYPTDPRQYTVERDGRTVVDGFAALDGYTRAAAGTGSPPAPTVFYRGLRERTSSLAVVQYWLYSAFDQFSVNFHWHDWELLQVFVDTDAGEPVLVVASAHSRKVPNNEHLDPGGPAVGLLSEVGSHSSATDVDGSRSFRRFPAGDLAADVTNALLSVTARIADVPFAYGLPRGEGGRLPFAVPELDGAPLYEHPALPNVGAADLVTGDLAVRNPRDLARPPSDLPTREPGLTMVPEGAAEDGDVAYALAPMADVESAVDGFAGPQLSFEFAVPKLVENAFADHLTSVGVPWEQPRYDQPLADVTDADHRRRIASRYDLGGTERTGGGGTAAGTTTAAASLAPLESVAGLLDAGGTGSGGDAGTATGSSNVVAAAEQATGSTEGRLRGAPAAAKRELEPEVGVTLTDPPVEAGCLLETPGGETVATTTVGRALRLTAVGSGQHRLVVNAPGIAPYADRFTVEDAAATVAAGAGGHLTLAAREDAVKLAADGRDAPGGLRGLRVTEDYAGTVYDAATPAAGDAVYLHRAGTYTVDLLDGEGDPGAARVDPADDDRIDLPVETGKAPMAEYLATYLDGSATLAREYRSGDPGAGGGGDGGGGGGNGDPGGGTTTTPPGGGGGGAATSAAKKFEAAAEAARRAAEAARGGNLPRADAQLGSVRERLNGTRSRIEAQRGKTLSETLATVLANRVRGSDARAAAALDSSK